jgi:lipoate-protein ligase B
VSTDLALFDLIVPCGISAVEMTSVCRECDTCPSVASVARSVTSGLAEVFDLSPSSVPLPALDVASGS